MPGSSRSSDLLVIGAGPAGCAAAVTAARAGLNVCLVDRATFPRSKTCGDAVSNLAARLLRQLGAGGVLEGPHATEVHGAVALLPGGARIERSYAGAPGYIVPRLELDAALLEAARDAGAQIHTGQAVRHLQRVSAGVKASGPDWSWQARGVIAADGPGSVAQQLLGGPKPKGRGLGVAATAYYRLRQHQDEAHSLHFFEHFLPCGYGWLFPSVQGLANARRVPTSRPL